MQDVEPTAIDVAIAVVESAGRFLVGRRGAAEVLAGRAEFPGGKIEPGETADAAARRECLEETGLAIDVVAALATIEHAYAHGRVRLYFFACRPVGPATPTARPPYRWVERDELATLDFPAANRTIVERLAAGG